MALATTPAIRLKPDPTLRAVLSRGRTITELGQALKCSRRTATAIVNGEPIDIRIARQFAEWLRETPELGLDDLIAEEPAS